MKFTVSMFGNGKAQKRTTENPEDVHELIAKINWNDFIGFFKLTENNALYQRTGYILEMMKNKTGLKIPSFVFEFLLKKVKNPARLIPINAKSIFNKKWKIQDNLGEKNILSWWH